MVFTIITKTCGFTSLFFPFYFSYNEFTSTNFFHFNNYNKLGLLKFNRELCKRELNKNRIRKLHNFLILSNLKIIVILSYFLKVLIFRKSLNKISISI